MAGTVLITFFGFHAIKTSKVGQIKVYMALVVLLGLLPIISCIALNFSDAYAVVYEPQSKLYQTWKVCTFLKTCVHHIETLSLGMARLYSVVWILHHSSPNSCC